MSGAPQTHCDVLPPPRLFERLEAPLAPLDALARGLWLGGMTNSQGRLVARLDGLVKWRVGLFDGAVPRLDETTWPDRAQLSALADAFERLGLAAYCRGNAELCDTVLQGLLFHLDLIVDYVDRGAEPEQALAMAVAAFEDDWAQRCGEMAELIEVFGDLGGLLKNTRWDQLRGLLRSGGWQEVLHARELIGRLPELARIIRQLGRARPVEAFEQAAHATTLVVERASASRALKRTVEVPELPGRTRGVQRSGRIARMLPAEAMMLAHPRLRLVWHARRAERALLTYEDDDHMDELRHERSPVWRPSPRPAPERRLEMGPMLLCVDTSGSMRGGAEAVAKAVVLEAVRAAHEQGRPCHVWAYGGPDEIVDLTLGVDAGGLEHLTRLLGQSFGGGTDICGPLERVIARLEQAAWQRADLLIASDGEFGATPELAGRLRALRERAGVRVQGMLIGDRETIGLLELADDIFWVRDWRRYGGSESDSPVHSKSLTAAYFPGALRSPENRDGTVSGADASAAVRAGRRPAAP
ncbi:MAG TPA: VWA domain-containing protein [Rhodocyclaceae bacterium]|nr:VWA domain-containing protein [Rhodocyclaceae bacterium]